MEYDATFACATSELKKLSSDMSRRIRVAALLATYIPIMADTGVKHRSGSIFGESSKLRFASVLQK